MVVSGSTDDMISGAELVVDASSDGKGVQNKNNIYLPKQKPAVFQGGESEDVAEISFNARSNFDEAKGKKYIRVVSCNTTAYCRILKPLSESYKIKNVDAMLIRRGADPNDAKGSALNAVEWKAKSHHAHDVQTVIDVPINSVAFKVPHTIAHINSMRIDFDEAPEKDDIYGIFRKESRVAVLNSATTSSQVMEAARDIGVKRYDTFAVSLLMNTVQINNSSVFMAFFVPQESIVVPENLDAICAQSGIMGKNESMRLTDEILGIGKIKSEMERIFA